jgi:glycosyltransferase involved in cell wall biosynthesis
MNNWVTQGDMANLLHLAGFEVVTTDSRILFPAKVPLLDALWNRWLGPLPIVRQLSLTNWGVARLPHKLAADTGTSVICPCRNESGNIPEIVRRLPEFVGPAELIFVEGNSQDDTLQECYRQRDLHPELDISVYRQTGRGKGDAVRLGFDRAKYPILMILDADMTVRPEDLPGFSQVIVDGSAEMVNGTRLVYAMERGAMRFLNLIANKMFAMGFSFLLGQSIKDTLCGTKVLLKADYQRLAAQRAYFGEMDPFGDFDLIFGAAKLGLQIRDYPIRYQARTFGTTQIQRFRHGWMLLKMYGVGLLKFKWR